LLTGNGYNIFINLTSHFLTTLGSVVYTRVVQAPNKVFHQYLRQPLVEFARKKKKVNRLIDVRLIIITENQKILAEWETYLRPYALKTQTA